eukprot:6142466-Ditylum_brightwellii.AAC.1
MKRKKGNYKRAKSECEKTKKGVENGLLYGDDNKADLSRNMLSICICPGCPRKKKHKTVASKECGWHNTISNVKNKDVPQALKQISLHCSPVSVHNVVEVLLEKIHERG